MVRIKWVYNAEQVVWICLPLRNIADFSFYDVRSLLLLDKLPLIRVKLKEP